MLTRRFERIALAQFLMGALVLGLIEHAQAHVSERLYVGALHPQAT